MDGNVVAESVGELFKNYNNFFVFVGATSIFIISFKVVASLWSILKTYILSPALGLGADLKSFGSWAGS